MGNYELTENCHFVDVTCLNRLQLTDYIILYSYWCANHNHNTIDLLSMVVMNQVGSHMYEYWFDCERNVFFVMCDFKWLDFLFDVWL